MSDPTIGRLIVPIVPDEARTFGMDALFRKFGIYAHGGQRYQPVDSEIVAFYREVENGHARGRYHRGRGDGLVHRRRHRLRRARRQYHLFFLFYSMFGFQRIGDPAERRRARQGLPRRRDGGTHHPRRRGAAAPGRTEPADREHRADAARAYDPAYAYARSRSSSRTASAACTSTARTSSTT
ncbi:MAG: hypothetical protein U1E86_28675 [Burkholderiaceae bacterium]